MIENKFIVVCYCKYGEPIKANNIVFIQCAAMGAK